VPTLTSAGVGSKVEINDCNGTGSQVWQLLSGTIKNPQSKLCLAVNGADLTPPVTALCANATDQS
jgi:Ricin-type beta-trefoil lectin domain